MWLLAWQGEIPVGIAVSIAVFAAVLARSSFGMIMAWYSRRKAAQPGLPSSWEEYPQV
jgi:hypothetical protein